MARNRAHLVIFPWPATGHFDPIVQLLYTLDAKRPRITVTVVSIGKMLSQLVDLQTKGDFGSIDLRLKEVYDADPRYEKDPVFPYRAKLTSESLYEESEAVRKELLALKGKPGAATAVISDMFLYWCKGFAVELGVPWYIYYPMSPSAAVLLSEADKVVETCVHQQKTPSKDELLQDAVPGLGSYPGLSSIYFGDIPEEPIEFPEFYTRVPVAMKQASGALINISEELDAPVDSVATLQKLLPESSNIFCIGPSLQMPGFGRIYSSISTSSNSLLWLDAQKEKSVVYVSFGSLAEMSRATIRDLASGLEASGVPFLWALKIGSAELSEVLPSGFAEKTSGRGLVETGWVPQKDILLHPATGGYFTHCGWNSILESICAGIPSVAWPVAADQFDNTRYVHDHAKIGVAIASFKDKNKHSFKDIGSRDIELAIRTLILGNEGRQLRSNVAKMQKLATEAVAPGGSSYRQFYKFLDEIDPQPGTE